MLDCLQEQSITLASFNARGLRQPGKRKTLYHHIRTQFPNLNILCLQETHLMDHEAKFAGQPWPSIQYNSHLSTHAGGVSFHLRKAWIDSLTQMPTFQTLIAGRAISCSFTAEDLTKYRILNVYAPPEATERQIFFQYLLDYIQKNWGGDQIIMGGDMNTVLDSSIDRRPTKAALVPSQINPKMDDAGSGALRRLVTVMGMQDIYRKTHPTVRQYTCRNVSRIDQWYATKTVSALCSSDHPIPPPVPSDHNLILMTISSSDNVLRGPGTWKANPGNWTSQEIREQINRILSDPKL